MTCFGELPGPEPPRAEPVDPVLERRTWSRRVGAFPFRRRELAGEGDRRELSGPQDLVGVRVSDSVEEARIGERAFDRVVLGGQRRAKRREAGTEDVDSARIHRRNRIAPMHHVQRRAAFRPRFGERQRTVGKIERGEVIPAAERRAVRPPMQTAGNHQVDDEPQLAVEADRDAFADPADLAHDAAFDARQRRIGGAQQGDAGDSHPLERLTDDARLEGA